MSLIDMESMLSEISPDAPCGDDLAYDPAFMELEGQLLGTPEIKMGDVVKQKAQPPDWHRIQTTTIELFQRTRDIRLAVTLVRALVHTAGLPGCRDGLRLLHGLMGKYWSKVHPHLDEEEDNDPTERLNVLETLCDWDSMIGPLTRVPVCTAPVIGSITMRDLSIATGKIKPPEKETASAMSVDSIDAAFRESEIAQLRMFQKATNESLETIEDMDAILSANVKPSGNGDQGPTPARFLPLQKVLKEMTTLFAEKIRLHPNNAGDAPKTVSDNGEEQKQENAPLKQTTSPKMENDMQPLQTRQDVVRSLDKICAYYDKNEPTSPVPLLLKRARRLVEKDFYEIMKDLAPDSLQQIELISGVTEDTS